MKKYSLITNQIVTQYKAIIKAELTGIYMHGSAAMGCFTQYSDIDLLVVINKPLDTSIYRQLIDVILKLDNLPAKGVEMSVVLKKHCFNFVYPTPFELHYSNSYYEKYNADSSFICGNDTDKDLACHFMVTRHRGICLTGEPINQVFANVSRQAFLDSIFYDIADAEKGIAEDPVYHILNLCRTLAYIREEKILSKAEGGLWAICHTDAKFHSIIKNASAEYANGGKRSVYTYSALNEFVKYMYSEIALV